MAKARMLSKTTSTSKQINQLSLKHAYIFITSIPHQDDWGRITKDPEVFKAIVAPMRKEITVRDCSDFMIKAIELGLAIERSDCLEYPGFGNHQKLSLEKRAKSTFNSLPLESPEIPKKSQEIPTQVNRRESNRTEDKLLRKEEASVFNQKLFKGFKDAGIEIQDSAGERIKYPSLFCRKNKDPDYWIRLAIYSQKFCFRPKDKQEYVFPWKGPVKLSKIYYEVREKYEEERSAKEGGNRYQAMKSKTLTNTKI